MMVGAIELSLPPSFFLQHDHPRPLILSAPAHLIPRVRLTTVDMKYNTAVASLKEDLESTTGTADEALEKINAATNPARECGLARRAPSEPFPVTFLPDKPTLSCPHLLT